jgi:hypothetical protein
LSPNSQEILHNHVNFVENNSKSLADTIYLDLLHARVLGEKGMLGGEGVWWDTVPSFWSHATFGKESFLGSQ